MYKGQIDVLVEKCTYKPTGGQTDKSIMHHDLKGWSEDAHSKTYRCFAAETKQPVKTNC